MRVLTPYHRHCMWNGDIWHAVAVLCDVAERTLDPICENLWQRVWNILQHYTDSTLKKETYLFAFSLPRISVASFFLGVIPGVAGVAGVEGAEGLGVLAVSWGPEPGLGLCGCGRGARGLRHWSQYTRTYSGDLKKEHHTSSFYFCVSFLVHFPVAGNNTSCHVPTGEWNDSSSYLRFDIYEELPLFYVGFVEFCKCKYNIGETRVPSSFSVDINRQSWDY